MDLRRHVLALSILLVLSVASTRAEKPGDPVSLERRLGDATEIVSVKPLVGRGDSITVILTYDDGGRAVFKPDHEKWFPESGTWGYRCRPWRAEVAAYRLARDWEKALRLRFPVTVRLEIPAQLLRQLVTDDPGTELDEVRVMEAILAGEPGHARPLYVPGTEDLVGSVQEWLGGGTKMEPVDGRRAERPVMEDLVARLDALHEGGTHGELWRRFANLVTFDFVVGNNDRACNFLFSTADDRILPIDNDSAFSVSWGKSWNRQIYEALPLVDGALLRRISAWLAERDDEAIRRRVFWPWPAKEGRDMAVRLRETAAEAVSLARDKARFDGGRAARPVADVPSALASAGGSTTR